MDANRLLYGTRKRGSGVKDGIGTAQTALDDGDALPAIDYLRSLPERRIYPRPEVERLVTHLAWEAVDSIEVPDSPFKSFSLPFSSRDCLDDIKIPIKAEANDRIFDKLMNNFAALSDEDGPAELMTLLMDFPFRTQMLENAVDSIPIDHQLILFFERYEEECFFGYMLASHLAWNLTGLAEHRARQVSEKLTLTDDEHPYIYADVSDQLHIAVSSRPGSPRQLACGRPPSALSSVIRGYWRDHTDNHCPDCSEANNDGAILGVGLDDPVSYTLLLEDDYHDAVRRMEKLLDNVTEQHRQIDRFHKVTQRHERAEQLHTIPSQEAVWADYLADIYDAVQTLAGELAQQHQERLAEMFLAEWSEDYRLYLDQDLGRNFLENSQAPPKELVFDWFEAINDPTKSASEIVNSFTTALRAWADQEHIV